MTGGVLIIGKDEKVRIYDAVAKARANVVSWEFIKKHLNPVDDRTSSALMLKDRPPGFERPSSEHVMLGTYRAAISFEQQPAGVMRHLSVSSMRKGRVPGHEVMQMVCEEFGFSKPLCQILAGDKQEAAERPWRLWLEEFEPGHMAVNVIEVEP